MPFVCVSPPCAAASPLAFMENQVKWNGMTFVTSPKWVFCGQVFRDTCHHPLSYDYTLDVFSHHFDTIGACIINLPSWGLLLFVSLLPLGAPRSTLIYLVIPESPNNDTAWHGIWDQYDFVLYITWNMETCVCVCVCAGISHIFKLLHFLQSHMKPCYDTSVLKSFFVSKDHGL